jgi:hypothetical protein
MSERFTSFFFTLVLLVNIYFLIKVEPHELKTLSDKVLSIFLFQFDYFFLFVYILTKFLKNLKKPLFLLSIAYSSLFLIGMSSLIIVDEKQFDIIYSYVQPCIRILLISIFMDLILEKRVLSGKTNYLLYSLWLCGGLYFLYMLNLFPRTSMFSFNLYWVITMLFVLAGIHVKRQEKPNKILFLIGVFFTGIADLYYILPPEARVFEFTYIFIRIINTIGEFLMVNHILRFYAVPTRGKYF